MRHSSFLPATEEAPLVLSPRALCGAGAGAVLTAGQLASEPRPVIVDGDPEEWAEAAAAGASRTLSAAPVATIGIARGTVSRDAADALLACDLRAGDADGVALTSTGGDIDRHVRTWLAGFARSPQACTAAALLLRTPHDLAAEAFAYSTLQSGREFAAWLRARASDEPTPVATLPVWDLDVAYAGEAVTVLADDRYREIVLTRPHRHNALDSVMRAELCDVLTTLPEDVAVGIRGAGRSFCSGGDLAEFGMLSDPAEAFFARSLWSVAERMRAIGNRLAVALHGACVGAGIELAAFARRAIAAPSTRIRLPETDFGLIPGSGGTVSIPERIGADRTLDLVVTARWLAPQEAKALGLVDEIVADDQLVTRLRAAAREAAP